jgi:hypothetical protein
MSTQEPETPSPSGENDSRDALQRAREQFSETAELGRRAREQLAGPVERESSLLGWKR